MLKCALSRSDVSTCKSIVDIPPESCFGRYYNCLRFHVKAIRLAKKVRKWFADGREKNKDLDYRFTGKESRLFCHNFMSIVKNLRMDSDQRSHTFQLHVFAHIAINLRDAVSLFSRVSISNEQVLSIQHFALTITELLHSFSPAHQQPGPLVILFLVTLKPSMKGLGWDLA